MKIYFSLILLSLVVFSSCVKDKSSYLTQEKKEVKLDGYEVEGEQPGGAEGTLMPGLHQIKLKLTTNGVESNRRFTYFMPVSIDKSKPISLIFNFHGSYNTGVDPLADVTMNHPLSQLAIKENCIVVFPAGEDTGTNVNWQNSDYHLPFVDAMVDYFKTHTPVADLNRIYTCGHSSGAIFSFVLASYRSEVFAAAVPVSGQMKLSASDIPSRTVPIRAFNGVTDATVVYAAASDNIKAWANTIGGYFISDAMNSDTLKIDNYKRYLTTKWGGGKADIEFYSILDEGHNISWYYIMPLMWEFMKAHPKNKVASGLYLSSQLKRFDAQEGQTFSSEIRYTEGATVSVTSAPSDWTVSYSNKILSVKAPNDFFGSSTINRKGNIKLKVERNGTSAEIILPYSLSAPKTYYEVGDVVYDAAYNPTGIVFWVNPANIKEAKIIALEKVTRKFGPVGSTFFTSDYNDGYGNTLALVARNKTLNLGLTAATSGFMYAYEYKASAGTTTGWYLPAVDELKLVDANLTTVNTALAKYGTVLETANSGSSYHLSSTVVSQSGKKFYTYDYHTNPSFHGYYILSASSDDTPFVSTRPIKKVTKP
jgi:poly(3-hydroxybutyrate) depolymerase